MRILFHGPYRYPDSYSHLSRNLLFELDNLGAKISCPNKYSSPIWEHVPINLSEKMVNKIKKWSATRFDNNYFTFQACVPPSFVYDPNSIANIGYTMFETSKIPTNWLQPLAAMDQIWLPTRWCRNVFAKTGMAKKILKVVPCGYDPEIFNVDAKPLDLPNLKNKIVFGCCFDWTPRKNGREIIASFLRAFNGQDDVVLMLKCFFKFGSDKYSYFREQIRDLRNLTRVNGKPDILVYPEIIPDNQMGRFYRTLDWHLSFTCGEGFNLPVLESMACGVPSIVTMWSGHMDFCNADNCLLIGNILLGPVPQSQWEMCGIEYYNSSWAYPSQQNMIENLRFAYEISTKAPQIREQIINCGLKTASSMTWKHAAQKAYSLFEAIQNGRT